MLELSNLLFIALGIVAGIVAGLIPSVNMAMPLMLLFPFVDNITIMNIFLFWAAVIIGSQYFGSVAAFTTRIPGETSSLIYINHVNKMSIAERLCLIKFTALGSTIATFSAVAICMLVLFYGGNDMLFYFNRIAIKATIFMLVLVLLVASSQRPVWVLLTMLIGVALGIKQNYSLPHWYYPVQEITDDFTFFMMMIGLIVIPDLVNRYRNGLSKLESVTNQEYKQSVPWRSITLGSAVGSILGLIPGPSATVATKLAMHTPGNTISKITAAESANNSAMITCMMPLLLVGVPITLSEIVVVQLLQVKLIDWPILDGENIKAMIYFVLGVCVCLSLAYYFLSTRFLNKYRDLLYFMQHQGRWLLIAIICGLLVVDFTTADISILMYVLGLSVFVLIGWILRWKNVDAMPMLFALILGDQIVWTVQQFMSLYL